MSDLEPQPLGWLDLEADEVHGVALQEHEARELCRRLGAVAWDRPELSEPSRVLQRKFEAYSQAWLDVHALLIGRTAVHSPQEVTEAEMSTSAREIGRSIAALRNSGAGRSQSALAGLIGISQSRLSRAENGELSAEATLSLLARVQGLNLE